MTALDAQARALFDTALDGVVVLDDEGRYVEVNASFCRMVGVERDELVGRTFHRFVPSARLDEALAAFEAMKRSGVLVVEIPLRRADGEVLDVEWSARAGPEPGLHFCTARDLTVQRRAERLLDAHVAVTRSLVSAPTLADAVSAILEPLARAIGAQFAASWIPHGPAGAPGSLSCVATWSASGGNASAALEAATRGRVLAIGQSLVGAAWAEGRAIERVDIALDDRFVRRAEALASGLRAALVLPVLDVRGEPLAVFEAYGSDPLRFDEALEVTLRAIGHDLAQLLRRSEAEQQARTRESDLEVILDALPVLVSSIDSSGRYQLVNRQYEVWFGQPRDQVIGRHVRDVLGDAAWAAVEESFARALRGESVTFEQWMPYANGRRYVHVSYVPRLVDGVPDGFFALVADLTERKNADEEVRRSRDVLRDFLENATIGLLGLAQDGTVLWANPAACELLVLAQEAVVGRPLAEILDDASLADEVLRDLAKGVAVRGRELRLRRSKEPRWVSMDASVLWDEGEYVYARCFLRDVTDRKRAAEADARLGAIVASSNDAIIAKDLDGIIVSWNEAAERLFGYTAAEAIGMPVARLAPPERPDDVKRIVDRIRAGERVEHFETERIRKDGQRLHVSLTVSPVRDEQGRVIGASKIARDITERKRSDEQVRRANAEMAAKTAQLEVANAELSRYASLVSHDLKTPLRAVQGYADFLAMDLGDRLDPQSADHLERLRAAVLHAEKLIDGLLELSRVGMKPAEPGIVDLPSFLRDMAASLRLPDQALIEVSGEGAIHCDTALLRLVFQDLILNGLKFNRSPAPRVDLEVESLAHEVVVRVTDNGIGIEPRHRDMVFGIFERLHRAEEFEGTGIGLAVVKKAVSRLGGNIRVEGAPSGQGTRFVVTLPKN